MANSLTKILVHITFSTRNRTSSIPEELEPRLYAYIGGVCRRLKSPLLTMNGTADHVHMLVSLDKNVTIPKLLLHVKRDSSTWMNEPLQLARRLLRLLNRRIRSRCPHQVHR